MDLLRTFLYTLFSFFPLQLISAQLLFAFRLKKRKYFWILLPLCLACYILVTWNIPYLYIYNDWLALKYIIVLVISSMVLYIPFKATFKEIIFCSIAGYEIQHIFFNVLMLFYTSFSSYWGENWKLIGFYALSFLITYPLGYFVFARRIGKDNRLDMKNTRLIICLVVSVFITQFLSMWLNHSNRSDYLTRIYALCSSILLLIVQFGFSREEVLENKNDALEQMVQHEKELYQISKENIDIINMKCHDLKKYLNTLTFISDQNERDRMKEDIEKSIDIYDQRVDTGNEALNVLIMDKNMRCKRENITLSYMLDGKLLSFMEMSDIYTLFGNILDNAIEAVLKNEKDKRDIVMKLYAKNGCIYGHVENSCLSKPRFENGLPLTSKSDKNNHGFGTQSIVYIVEKYKGQILMSMNDERFSVDMLFIGRL